MALKARLTIVLALLAVLSAALLVRELVRLVDAHNYNAAIAAERFAEAADHGGDFGHFAKAYAEQREGRFQDARMLYSALEHSENERLRLAASYNMGNTFLQQAARIDLDNDADRALPLVELAKDRYRAVLAADSAQWDARYNLERALQIAPDVGERRLPELDGLRGAIRTINSADPEGDLP